MKHLHTVNPRIKIWRLCYQVRSHAHCSYFTVRNWIRIICLISWNIYIKSIHFKHLVFYVRIVPRTYSIYGKVAESVCNSVISYLSPRGRVVEFHQWLMFSLIRVTIRSQIDKGTSSSQYCLSACLYVINGLSSKRAQTESVPDFRLPTVNNLCYSLIHIHICRFEINQPIPCTCMITVQHVYNIITRNCVNILIQ